MGLDGARAVASGADLAVVVDVLTFTTCVSVAVDRGAIVFPYAWKDAGPRISPPTTMPSWLVRGVEAD
ncbi:lipoprotein [Arthrobacter sp. Hiyo8]|nr:lipoprotein [Arthrobacter sp. Hiyo8]